MIVLHAIRLYICNCFINIISFLDRDSDLGPTGTVRKTEVCGPYSSAYLVDRTVAAVTCVEPGTTADISHINDL
jgi:hypothetical protein